MKKNLSLLIVAMCLLCSPVFSQSAVDTTNKLGLAGDNLDLYAVLTLFQKSKTIEAFEKSLNDEQTKINNLDLNLDKKVDFIKVTTKKEDSAFTFILQVDVTKTETQDVAIILVNKEKGVVSIQAVGDPELYGKDYVIEPKGQSSVTANPGYTGADPVIVNVEATPATTVVVQQAPIVQYVYSPAYAPYYPPYYYGYYPGWFAFSAVVTWGIYAGFHSHYHGGYYGGHYGGGNTVIVNNGNRNQINHYNNSRNRSNTVSDNKARGNYGDGRGSGNRGSTGINDNMRGSNNNRGSTGINNNMSNNRGSTGNRASTGASNNMSSNRGSTSRPSTSNMSSGRTMSGGGGGRSMGGGGGGRRR